MRTFRDGVIRLTWFWVFVVVVIILGFAFLGGCATPEKPCEWKCKKGQEVPDCDWWCPKKNGKWVRMKHISVKRDRHPSELW